ncbi:receptor-type tyrosine-protein phosphatase beta-like [Saccoglossus kowalevskii]
MSWLWLLLGVLLGVLIAVAIILAIIYYKRRYYEETTTRTVEGTANPEFIGLRDENGKPPIAQKPKTQKHSKPVKLAEYHGYFQIMSADMEFRFSEEYDELRPVGREQSWDAAELPENRAKNRYTNILPYDRTRVKLSQVEDDEATDYLNANWMPGFNSPREFIAVQGTLPGTKDDFWRMIWEYNVSTIVMVTQCQERGRVKCERYWPTDDNPVYYGDVLVTVTHENELTDWVIREFTVENGKSLRRIRHFNFTAWPDHGVPEETGSLIKFVRSVRAQIQNDGTPTVVHCSAGVGRTGTFIALDRLIQHIKEYDYVDIFGIACEMRMHRVYMIQTESQYIFIHLCVDDLLKEREQPDEPDEPDSTPDTTEHIYGNVPSVTVMRNGPDVVTANLGDAYKRNSVIAQA